jgi:uncharacterized membrane protein (DUF4010 family)
VSPVLLRVAALPIVLMMIATAAPAVVSRLWERKPPAPAPEQGNPAELRPAIAFAIMYSVVLLALAAAKEHLGGEALYGVAALSGLTDMDAITLSTSRLVNESIAGQGSGISAELGWRLVVVATIANLMAKSLISGVAGGAALFRRVLGMMAVPAAAGIALLLFW